MTCMSAHGLPFSLKETLIRKRSCKREQLEKSTVYKQKYIDENKKAILLT